MIASRRLHYNFALDRALEHCTALGKPLVIFEALRIDYPWASDRLHRFVLDGMAENAQHCQEYSVRYYPYIEPARGAGKGLLAALAEKSCVVVTDNFPCFFLPHMVASVAKKLPVLLESVDSNGLLPLHATDQVFTRASDFRRFLQKELAQHLVCSPHPDPLAKMKLPSTASLSRKLTSIGRWLPKLCSLAGQTIWMFSRSITPYTQRLCEVVTPMPARISSPKTSIPTSISAASLLSSISAISSRKMEAGKILASNQWQP